MLNKKSVLCCLLCAALLLQSSGCGSPQNDPEPSAKATPTETVRPVETVIPVSKSPVPTATAQEETASIYADFSNGDANAQSSLIHQYTYAYSGELTPEILAQGLSSLTQLNFSIQSSTTEEGRLVIDWNADSGLLAGVDSDEQSTNFAFDDDTSLNWFMLDSLDLTLRENLGVAHVYYTMLGGAALEAPGIDRPSSFSPNEPYMGSVYYLSDEYMDDIPSWWGEYKMENGNSIGITNFNGKSFLFTLTSADGKVYEGAAVLLSNYQAQYGNLIMNLSEDQMSITIAQYDEATNNDDDTSPYHGHYDSTAEAPVDPVPSAGLEPSPGTSAEGQNEGKQPIQSGNITPGGLRLKLSASSEGASFVGAELYSDQTYFQSVMFDSLLTLSLERHLPTAGDENAIRSFVSSLEGIAPESIVFLADDALSAKLNYPVYRLEYITGANEDTNSNLDIYITTDSWDLRMHISCDADSYEEYGEKIENWISGLSLVE